MHNLRGVLPGGDTRILEMAIAYLLDEVADPVVMRFLWDFEGLVFLEGFSLHTKGDERNYPNSERLELNPPCLARKSQGGFRAVINT